MPGQSHVSLPCGRTRYCGRKNGCPHIAFCTAQAAKGSEAKGTSTQPRAKGTWRAPQVADVVYLYDGSLAGLLCCVHESVYAKEEPRAIWPEYEVQPTLYPTKYVETDFSCAKKVENSIPVKIAPRALEIVQNVFLSCLPEKERAILRFLLLGYEQGVQVPWMLGHERVSPLLKAEKHLLSEAHLLKGFIRFSDYDGRLAATISPKNFVLPYLRYHFASRYSGETFLIYDKTHRAALIYENRQSRIVPMEGIEFPQADEKEERYRALWKQFYNTIAIAARENPRCRMTQMPKRYWENMLEVKDLL